ncbi:unnamed protein product [Agarophyton chilense]
MSKFVKLFVLYASSFASLLCGAHLIHITVKPDMKLDSEHQPNKQPTDPEDPEHQKKKKASDKPLISIAVPQTTKS